MTNLNEYSKLVEHVAGLFSAGLLLQSGLAYLSADALENKRLANFESRVHWIIYVIMVSCVSGVGFSQHATLSKWFVAITLFVFGIVAVGFIRWFGKRVEKKHSSPSRDVGEKKAVFQKRLRDHRRQQGASKRTWGGVCFAFGGAFGFVTAIIALFE